MNVVRMLQPGVQRGADAMPSNSTPALTPNTASQPASAMASGDLDGDGDPDVLAAGYGPGELAWWANLGGDPIAWAKHTILSMNTPGDAQAADFDGDGDLDLAVAVIIGGAFGKIIASLVGDILMPLIGLKGILLIDIATFLLAIGALLLVEVPPPVRTEEGRLGSGNILHEAAYGFKYIFKRPSLLGFVIMLFFANVFLGFPNAVTVPIILSRTGNSSIVLGAVQTAGTIAWTAGSLIMSVWGGPKRRLNGVLLGWIVYCLAGNVIFGLGRGLGNWIPSILVAGIGSSIGVATSQALLQAKVAPDVQGRVFSARRLLTWFPDAFTPILGGLLADRVMEPAMKSGGWLSILFGWMSGTDAGAGMSVIMVVSGFLTILTLLCGFIFPGIRNMETILPDHDQLTKIVEPSSSQ